jgi:hypothetical protein
MIEIVYLEPAFPAVLDLPMLSTICSAERQPYRRRGQLRRGTMRRPARGLAGPFLFQRVAKAVCLSLMS